MDMAENLRHGAVPARWMAHAAYDLGYPFFNHYAALPYYVSGGLTALGLSPLIAIQATQTLGLVLSGLTMVLWARRIHRTRVGVVLSVAAYIFAPFHLVNLYVRGDSLSEFYAFVWYPLILWSLDRLADQRTDGDWAFRRIVTASLAYGGLILTHNVSLLIFSPFALLYALLRLRPQHLTWRTGIRTLLTAASPFVLGMVLTAWFWVPALVEVTYGQLGDAFTEGYFHYSRHFRGLNLIQPHLAFDYSVSGQVEGAGAFATGLVQAGLALLGSVLIVLRTIKSRATDPRSAPPPIAAGYLLLGLFVSTLMITPLSEPLWAHLPLLATTQFPWRFLSIQALFTAILTGAIVPLLAGEPTHPRQRSIRRILGIVLCVMIAASGMLHLRPDRLRIDEDIDWDTLLLYETFTGNIGTTIRYEYLPANVVPRLYISESVIDGMGAVEVDGDAKVEAVQVKRTPTLRRWHVELDRGPARVVFPLHAWPGWRAWIDDVRTPVAPLEGSGRLSLTLPAGEHEVELKLGPTPVRAWSMGLSGLAGLAASVTLIVRQPSRSETGTNVSPKQPSDQGRPRGRRSRSLRVRGLGTSFEGLTLALGALLAIGLPLAFHRDTEMLMRVFDFETMPYPHAGPVDFGPAALTEAAPIPETVKPGSGLIVPLHFDVNADAALTGTLRLVSPAEPRHGVPYRLAETQFTLACGEGDEAVPDTEADTTCNVAPAPHLTMPANLSRGLYLLQLTLEDSQGERRGQTAQDRTMGTLYVDAVRVRQGPPIDTDTSILGKFDELALHNVDLAQPDPTTVHLTMTWSTPGTPRNWSMSVRLINAEGQLIAQHDQQPGYGYLPTSLWNTGERMTDQVFMQVPEGLAPGKYTLRVITYLRSTMAGGGEHDIPVELNRPTLYDLRDACCEQTRKGRTILCQAAGIALIAAERPEAITQGDNLTLSAEWNAVETPTADLMARWALVAPDGRVRAESEGPLAPGSEPTTWPRHTWVEKPVTVPLPAQLEPGDYTLQLTLAANSQDLATCTMPQDLTVTPRPRVFAVPEIPNRTHARFGDQIALLGYDLTPDRPRQGRDTTLQLTLWWRARTEPATDYKRFVHLYAPHGETIVAQDDAMPRAWTYPTSWWAAGEVVSETVTLDISGTDPNTYHLAVGWYDPATMDRLPALDGTGTRQPSDRILLDTVTLR